MKGYNMVEANEVTKRMEIKFYKVVINNITNISVPGYSLGQVLRHVADMLLDDTDIVTVRLDP